MTTISVRCNIDNTMHELKVDDAMLLRLAVHGAQQKGNDSYVDAKRFPTLKDKKAQFLAVMENLAKGEWGRERNSDPIGNLAWDLFRHQLRAATGLKGKELDAKAEALWDKNESTFRAAAEKELAARKARMGGVTIDMAV